MPQKKSPEDPKPKLDFEDIAEFFDKELKELIDKTDDREKKKELMDMLRGK